MVLDKRTTPADAVGYIVAQIIGAIGAAAVILVTVEPGGGHCRHHRSPEPASRDISALILEIVFTAIFLVVILTASKRAACTSPGSRSR